MPCTYQSRSIFQTFEDQTLLQKALKRLSPEISGRLWHIRDGRIKGERADLDLLQQAYQVEAAKLAAKKKGFFVTERKLDNGNIKLTIRR